MWGAGGRDTGLDHVRVTSVKFVRFSGPVNMRSGIFGFTDYWRQWCACSLSFVIYVGIDFSGHCPFKIFFALI